MELCRDATNKHVGLVHALRCKCKRKYKCRYKQRPYFQRKRQDDRYAGTAQDFFTEPWWHLRLRCVGPLTRVQCTNILTHTAQMDTQGSEHFTISCLGAYSCVCICVKLVHTWRRMKTEWKRSPATPAPQDTYPGGLIVTQLHFIHCCLFKTFDYKSDPSYSSNSRAALAYVKRSQQRTISEKIWFSMHPRNFGSDKIVRTYVRTST